MVFFWISPVLNDFVKSIAIDRMPLPPSALAVSEFFLFLSVVISLSAGFLMPGITAPLSFKLSEGSLIGGIGRAVSLLFGEAIYPGEGFDEFGARACAGRAPVLTRGGEFTAAGPG